MAEFQRENGRWVEGNDKVKVVAVYVNQPHHRVLAVVEVDNLRWFKCIHQPLEGKWKVRCSACRGWNWNQTPNWKLGEVI